MADIAELIVALNLRDGVSSGLANLNRQLGTMQGGLKQVGRGVSQVGAGLDKALTRGAIAAGAGLTAVVTTAASFEQAFTGVEKTVDGTDAQLKELESTFRQMARTMPISFEELAGIGEAGGALGIARESLDEFTDVVARLSVSTDLTADSAATALGQLGNVLHLSGADFEDFADSLVALGNAGASTESQIVDMAARFGAAGNSAGLSKEEILALSSAVASMGIEAEAGGTSLSRIFGNVATAIGTGSDDVEAFTELLGISADEFQKRWGEDALGTFQDFLTELGKLDQFGQARVLEQAGITGARDINAVRLMAQNVGFLGDQLTIAEEAQGALRTESDKFFNTTSGQWQILKNNVRDAAATIGTEMLPVVNDLIKEFVGFLSKPDTQQGLKDFGKGLADGVRDLVTEIRKVDWGPLIAGMETAGSIAKAAFDAFRSLPPQVQAIAAGAFALNKATGGAVTQITKGLGNIAAGAIKIAFPKLDIFTRGSTPANPLWVQSVGGVGGIGGGVVGGAGKGGIGGFVGGALKFLPAVFAAEVASQASPVLGEVASDIHEEFLGFLPEFDLEDLQWPFGSKNTPTILPEIFGGNGLLGGNPGTGRTRGGSFAPEKIGEAIAKNLGKRGTGALESGTKLDADEIITLLKKTSEIGLEGIGTQIEDGVARGTDPLGDTMVKLLARAEDPKAPAVMDQIQGHIAALEEVQRAYAATGDDDTVQHLQTNIDKLNTLIGTTDQTRTLISLAKGSLEGKLSTQISQNETGNTRLSTLEGTIGATLPKLDTANIHLANIEGKSFSPIVKVENHNTVSSTIITTQQRRDSIAAGTNRGGVQR